MRKGLLLICALLCTNVLLAQTTFTIGDLTYRTTGSNTVEVNSCDTIVTPTAIVIPSTVTYLGITYNVTSIGRQTFYGCYNLTSINIPNSVTSIESFAFSGCSSLVSINIPNSVTSIGSYAFDRCNSLTSINIPNSVTYIGEYAFNGVKLITYHGTATGSPWGALSVNGYVENEFIYHDNTKRLLLGYIGSDTNLVIPSNVIYIGNNAFLNCNSLTSVIIPNNVTFIGSSAFKNCSNLISIIISDSITSIESETFSNCSSLASIAIPNSVTSIKGSAFINCGSLTSITIPNSITYIDSMVFHNCSSLTTVNFNVINCNDFFQWTSPFYNCPISTINIGNGVQRIPSNFAYNLDSLNSINIPNSVTSIGEQAFYDCNNLALVNIPNSVTSIGYNAFYQVNTIIYNGTATGEPWGANTMYRFVEGDFVYSDSTKTILLKYLGSQANVVIPNTVTTIGQSAFSGCNSIVTLTIPSNVTLIEYNAFNGCSNLTTLNFNAINCSNVNSWSSPFDNCSISTINIGDSVQRIPNSFARGLSSLTSITIPNSVTYIGDYAFYYCSSLASINISDSVNYIGQNAFWGSAYYGDSANWENNLLYLNNWLIAARTTSAGEYVIRDSTRGIAFNTFQNYVARTIKSESLIPPIITNGSNGLGINNTFTVNVSCQALSAYLADPDWAVLNVQASPYDVVLSATNPTMGSARLINNTCGNTTIQAYPNQGYAFKQWSDGNTENPRSVILTCDTAFIAIFEAMKTVSVSSVNETMGTVIGGGEYELNSSATVAAVPNNGYRFTNWNNNSTINPYTFTVTRDTNLVAYFEEIIPDTAFVHDTTYINVPVHDTTIITQIDTVTVTNTVFDTVINTVYDTIINTVHDTTYINVPVHDTTIITHIDTVINTVHDTTYVNVPVHDTTIITQIDTITITNTVFDTVINTVHDTTYINVPVHDTTIITQTDTIINTVHDTITTTLYDTIDNFIYDTVYLTETDTLWLFDTVYLHDTIYIHETIYITDSTTGIEDVAVINARVYSSHSRIVVEGAEGNNVMLFDMNGRLLATRRDEYARLEFEVPISGAYFVKIGNYRAQKVVVIK